VPLLKRPQAVPEDHTKCEEATDDWGRCTACRAERGLLPSDWEVVEFYRLVCDQVRNQAPMGTESGKPVTTPVLADWIAALEFYGFTPEVLDMARWLHSAIEDRAGIRYSTVAHMSPADLGEPDE